LSSERKFIKENVRRHLLKEYLFKETQRAGFGGLDVARTPMGTHITLIAERPGMVIGRRGATINRLTEEVETVFGFDNPQIEVQESEVPALNPHIMAQKLAIALEKGWHFRRAGHSTVMRIMEAGARGCQVEISGKLTGDRHRTVKFRQGHIKYCGEPKNQWMRVAITTAAKKSGVLGLKVLIMDPDAKLPDEIEILPPEELTEILEEYKSEVEEAPIVVIDAEPIEEMVEAEVAGEAADLEVLEKVPAPETPKEKPKAKKPPKPKKEKVEKEEAEAPEVKPKVPKKEEPKAEKPKAPKKEGPKAEKPKAPKKEESKSKEAPEGAEKPAEE
jgi:small subunit ribosomal protein S3